MGPTYPETSYTPFRDEQDAAPVRLIVRRVRPTPGSQLAAFVLYDYHAFITDRDGEMLELEADHRRHAEIENALRDLKYGVALNHLPSGKFAANGAWLAVQVIAHNLARWTARIGLGAGIVTTKTLRRRLFGAAAVRPGRAADPLGPQAHSPPAGPLAMGDRLGGRTGANPVDPAPRLTAPDIIAPGVSASLRKDRPLGVPGVSRDRIGRPPTLVRPGPGLIMTKIVDDLLWRPSWSDQPTRFGGSGLSRHAAAVC